MKALLGLLSVPTVTSLAGGALTVAGLHMVWSPLAYIVPGAALTTIGLWMALGTTRDA